MKNWAILWRSGSVNVWICRPFGQIDGTWWPLDHRTTKFCFFLLGGQPITKIAQLIHSEYILCFSPHRHTHLQYSNDCFYSSRMIFCCKIFAKNCCQKRLLYPSTDLSSPAHAHIVIYPNQHNILTIPSAIKYHLTTSFSFFCSFAPPHHHPQQHSSSPQPNSYHNTLTIIHDFTIYSHHLIIHPFHPVISTTNDHDPQNGKPHKTSSHNISTAHDNLGIHLDSFYTTSPSH